MSAGDTLLGHTQEQAEAYRAVTAGVAHRQASGLSPAGSSGRITTTLPAGPPLPSVQVARQVIGAEMERLALQAGSLRRQAEGPAFNPLAAAGNPYAAQAVQDQQGMREQARGELARVRAELARLEAVMADDHKVMAWAAEHMATTPVPVRTR